MTILVSGTRVQVVADSRDREFMEMMLSAMGQAEQPVRSSRSEGCVINEYAGGRVTYDFVNEPGMQQPWQK